MVVLSLLLIVAISIGLLMRKQSKERVWLVSFLLPFVSLVTLLVFIDGGQIIDVGLLVAAAYSVIYMVCTYLSWMSIRVVAGIK